jgi:serine protease Do
MAVLNRFPLARSGMMALALAMASAAPVALAPQAAQARAPESFADLAEAVSDAVVNISATQKVEERRPQGFPQMGPGGTPFDDLFEEFFKRRGQRGGAPHGQGEDAPRSRKSNSLGSGFVIDPSGIVVTNNHVVADSSEVTVIFNDGQKLKAEVLGRDAKVDVAVLRVKPEKPLKAVNFGDSDKMRVGDWVMAVGNPFGLGGTVTAGIVSARNRNIDSGPYDNYLQTDASINKGNSGGPLFNMAGEVIGINTAILSPSGGSIGIGFASPSSTVLPVISQLREFGETRRGWLGVRIQNVDDSIADSLGLGKARGALVAGVDDKGPAKPAGLKTGDVIVKFDGREVKESRDLPKIVAATPVGKAVDVIVMRDGKEVTKSVTLGRLEDGEKLAARGDKGSDADAGGGEKITPQKSLGMSLSPLNDAARQKYQIKDSVKVGVVVTGVDRESAAAEKVQPGDVVVEINQEPVVTVDTLSARAKALKEAGKKTALLLVANAGGDVRFVVVPLN